MNNDALDIENKNIIDTNNKKKKYKKKMKSSLYCGNCGKHGHMYKNCKDPITSYGVIIILLSTNENIIIDEFINSFKISNNEDEKIKYSTICNKYGINCDTPLNLQTFCNYKNNIKFLLIRRRYTVGYSEFIRGRYSVDNVNGVIFLFMQMTPNEIKRIGSSTFDELWNEMWGANKNKTIYQHEYIHSKNKFEKLKNDVDNDLGLDFYVKNVQASWNYAEWCFPKGRRNHHEDDLECGLREFEEESGFVDNDYILLDKMEPLEEIFIGTDGITYKHVYFMAIAVSDKIPKIDSGNKVQSSEIGDIGWYTYEEAINLFRPQHTNRKKLLTEIYMYILNTIINIKQQITN